MAQARAGGGQSGGASGRGGGSGPAGEWGSGPLGRAPRLGVRAPRLSAARGSGASRQPRATLAAPAVVRSPRSEPGRGAPARSRGSPCGRHWPPRGPLSPRRSRQRLDYLLSLFGLLLPQTELLTPKHGTGPEQPLQPPAAAPGRGVPCPVLHGEGLCARTYRCPLGNPARHPGSLFAGCARRCLCPLPKYLHPSCPQYFSISSSVSRALVLAHFSPETPDPPGTPPLLP